MRRTAAMNSWLKKFIYALVCALLAAAFITVMRFCAPTAPSLPEAEGSITYTDAATGQRAEAVLGEDLAAVRINDFGKINRITKVNYVADKFVNPGSLTSDIQVVDLTQPFEFAGKGTLIFIVMNLDAESDDFHAQADALADYKIGDYWTFTLSLPQIFCASNVYLKSNLVARHGEIEGYDFINFTTTYDKTTDNYSQKTERTSLELQFYTRRQALNAYQMIVVHYQSSGTSLSGLNGYPLIGTEDAVNSSLEGSHSLLIAAAMFAAVALAVLVALSVLKRTREFIPSVLLITGITLILFSRFVSGQATVAPLVWAALSQSAAFVTLGGALLAQGKAFGRFPVAYIFSALSAAGFICAFVCPFVSFGAAAVLGTVCAAVKGAGAVALLVSALIPAGKDNGGSAPQSAASSVIAVAVFASLFLPEIFPAYCNSVFWLCVATVAVTFASVFKVFKDAEKANAYLTANMNMEVERQLKEIKAVVTERDNLLQFVSHDMKKPLTASAALIDTVAAREKDAEQKKALEIIRQNTARVIGNLSEIGAYARFNYIAEPSITADLAELCASLYGFHRPDCNANGIVLKNLVDKHFRVFVKKQGLENAVSNIILNAVEHADCTSVTLSAKAVKDRIVLCIADNGKGIDADADVFRPYVSTNKPDTGGVGLFICRNIIESMNGTLTYESGSGGTSFYISLLKA